MSGAPHACGNTPWGREGGDACGVAPHGKGRASNCAFRRVNRREEGFGEGEYCFSVGAPAPFWRENVGRRRSGEARMGPVETA